MYGYDNVAVMAPSPAPDDEVAKVVSLDAARLQGVLKHHAADVRRLLSKQMAQSRQMLRNALVGRLAVTPVELNGQKGFRFEGQGSYGKLLTGESKDASYPATSHGVPSGTRYLVQGEDTASGAAGSASNGPLMFPNEIRGQWRRTPAYRALSELAYQGPT